jgi:hypothetical protein
MSDAVQGGNQVTHSADRLPRRGGLREMGGQRLAMV